MKYSTTSRRSKETLNYVEEVKHYFFICFTITPLWQGSQRGSQLFHPGHLLLDVV
jgi:hypothetical protein